MKEKKEVYYLLQFFNRQKLSNSFEAEPPKILYSCRTEEYHFDMPRAMHMHENWAEIVFITKGAGIHNIGGKQFFTKKGDLLIYNAGVIHDESATPDDSLSVFALGIGGLQLKGRLRNHLTHDGGKPVIDTGEYEEEINWFMQAIHCYVVSNSQEDSEIAHYLLKALILAIDKNILTVELPDESEQRQNVERIQRYLDKYYLEDINLKQISENLNINLYYMSHLFKESTGYSPMQYVIRRRIGEAQSLLITTDESVTKIANTVGYNNSNHFHAAFQKLVGMTPGKYRKYWVKKTLNTQEK